MHLPFHCSVRNLLFVLVCNLPEFVTSCSMDLLCCYCHTLLLQSKDSSANCPCTHRSLREFEFLNFCIWSRVQNCSIRIPDVYMIYNMICCCTRYHSVNEFLTRFLSDLSMDACHIFDTWELNLRQKLILSKD